MGKNFSAEVGLLEELGYVAKGMWYTRR